MTFDEADEADKEDEANEADETDEDIETNGGKASSGADVNLAPVRGTARHQAADQLRWIGRSATALALLQLFGAEFVTHGGA